MIILDITHYVTRDDAGEVQRKSLAQRLIKRSHVDEQQPGPRGQEEVPTTARETPSFSHARAPWRRLLGTAGVPTGPGSVSDAGSIADGSESLASEVCFLFSLVISSFFLSSFELAARTAIRDRSSANSRPLFGKALGALQNLSLLVGQKLDSGVHWACGGCLVFTKVMISF